MRDSERAANIALERQIDAGLHLNLTAPFTADNASARLVEYQQKVSAYLRRHRLAQVVFHPGLKRCFEYVVAAQRGEFARLYQKEPARIDGHHHMHLCANVVLAKLLPAGVVVRRDFSAQPGEKSAANRLYRQTVDRVLRKRHPLTKFFFSIEPLTPSSRVQSILSLAKEYIVEVETHPVNRDEYEFLTGERSFVLPLVYQWRRAI